MKDYICSINVCDNYIDLSIVKQMKFEDGEIGRYSVHRNDLLVCEGGDAGRSALWNKDYDMCYQNAIHRIRFFSLIEPNFYLLVFKAYKSSGIFKSISKGETIQHLTSTALRQLVYPLPPLSEQKRIVSKIEKLFPLVDKYGEAYSQLNELEKKFPSDLKKSILQYAMEGKLVPQIESEGTAKELYKQIQKEKQQLIKKGEIKKGKPLNPVSKDEIPFDIPQSWMWVRLESLSANIDNAFADGPFGSNLKSIHYTDKKEVRIVQLSNIGEDGWKDKNVKYTTYEHLKTIERSEIKSGDIAIAKMMPAGRAIIIPNTDDKYVLSSDAVKFVCHPILFKPFLLYAINSGVFRKQIVSEVQGITRVRTSISKLKSYILPLPPLSEQKRIVTKIEELFAIIDKRTFE